MIEYSHTKRKWGPSNMGYRVIIADDEPKIIELIRQLGHWEELEIEIIEECHTGRPMKVLLKNVRILYFRTSKCRATTG
jgi:hypothetical protein